MGHFLSPVPWASSRSRIVRRPQPGFIAPSLHEGGRCNDRDSPERIEREEIGIAGDDQIGMAVDSQLQKFVVLRITTGSDSNGYRDQLGRYKQFMQPISKARRDQRRKSTVSPNSPRR